MIGRFGVVKLWPGVTAAEDECIARLKLAAQMLGLECVEISADGEFLRDQTERASKRNLDFVLHLHYDTPKAYDAFSFVALWNPLRFYADWGYRRTSRNLLSHDDFLSCSSVGADDHVIRMIRHVPTHLPPRFRLYHSLAEVVNPPSLGDYALFYAGINWDALNGGKSRHQSLLQSLDEQGVLRIYGPEIFQGVRVWAGYKSYVGAVPFDGISLVKEISKAGIALVFSSEAHKASELMSNRLFESVAAGALVICDENRFAKRHFGDSLLYVDSRLPTDVLKAKIVGHIDWARRNPEAALEKITAAQKIFRDGFTLSHNLRDLYSNLDQRKAELSARQNPPEVPAPKINAYFLAPDRSDDVIATHLASIASQDYSEFRPFLVVDRADAANVEQQVAAARGLPDVELVAVEFYGSAENPRARRKLGEVLLELMEATPRGDALVFVGPDESLLSNHLSVLAGALQRRDEINCAATAVLRVGDKPPNSVDDVVSFSMQARLPGYGRFIFRTSAIPTDIQVALRHLDRRALAALVGGHAVDQLLPATVSIALAAGRSLGDVPCDNQIEEEIIRDYSPGLLAADAWMNVPAPNPPPATFLRRAMSVAWIRCQLKAIQEQGARARLRLLKTRVEHRLRRST